MAIIVGILCLATLIVVHEAGHFFAARAFKMRVKRFSIGFSKPLIKWKPKGSDTTYSIGALPLGGYVQIDGLSPVDEVDPDDRFSYANQPIYAKLIVIIAGPLANFLTAALLFVLLFATGMPTSVDEPIIGRLEAGDPADQAGFQRGDRLLKINNVSVENWNDMAREIQSNRGKSIAVQFQRGDTVDELELTPDPDNGRIGISPARTLSEPLGIGESFSKGFQLAGLSTAGVAIVIYRIVTRQQSTEGVSGPVGIVKIMNDAVTEGWPFLLFLLAQLSISLCLFNFLPVPALDGGRVVFLSIEAITRRRVNKTVEGYVHAVGMVLVIGLLLVVTFRDIMQLL